MKNLRRTEIGLSVLKDYWGPGIASRLLDTMISFGKSSHIEIITPEVRSDNHRACWFYGKGGFGKYGTYHRFEIRSSYDTGLIFCFQDSVERL